jgi:hypothetical protein
MGSDDQFMIGARVRLSQLGFARSPKMKVHTGVVVALPFRDSGSSTVRILFDGAREPRTVHRSYVELDEDDMIRRLVELGLKAKEK